MRIVRPVVRTTITLQETVRDLSRLREVAVVLARHGLGALVAGLNIPGVKVRGRTLHSTPERVVDAIEELGPTFVKFGQVMSTRPDILPPAYLDALQSLQDDVAPFPPEDVRRQLQSSLGEDWSSTLVDFHDTPMATGSIAQVHTARLASGEEVVAKILRPRIRERIRADISILNLLVQRLLVEFPEATYFDPEGMLKEFERSIRDETDLLCEADNMLRFRANFAEIDEILVPAVYRDLSTSDVLVQERVRGRRIREARAAGADMEAVGRAYLRAAYKMLFEDGFFHGDLHPGNVFVLEGDRLALLDFGMVGRLTPEMKDNLVTILFALEKGDFRSISRIYYDLGIKTARVDYDAFERDVVDVMERHWVGRSIQEIQLGGFLKSLADGAIRHQVRAPPNYTMFFKAVLTTEGLAKSLTPEVDPIEVAQPYVNRLIKDRFRPERLKEELLYHAMTLRTLERRVPVAFSQLLDDVQGQRLLLNVISSPTSSEIRSRHRRHTLVVVAGMSMASLLAGTLALYMNAPSWAAPLGIPWLSILLYLSSGVFWLWTLWLLYKGGRSRGSGPGPG